MKKTVLLGKNSESLASYQDCLHPLLHSTNTVPSKVRLAVKTRCFAAAEGGMTLIWSREQKTHTQQETEKSTTVVAWDYCIS